MTRNLLDCRLPGPRCEPHARRIADARDYARASKSPRRRGLPLVEATLPDCRVSGRDARRSRRRARVQRRRSARSARLLRAPSTPSPRSLSRRCRCSSCAKRRRPANGGSRIEVQTAGGTQVNVPRSRSRPAAGRERPHPHHRRARQRRSVRAIQFEWQSPDGASQAQVSIEASEDLDRWRVLVPQHAVAGDSRQRADCGANASSCRRKRTTTCACSERTAVRRSRSIA